MGRSHHEQVRPVLRGASGPRQLARCEFGTLGPVVTEELADREQPSALPTPLPNSN